MRFITQFELPPPAIEERINAYKSRSNFELGDGIADVFGYKNSGVGRSSEKGLSEIKERFTLAIEAFPVDKWVEFKRQFFVHLGATGIYEPGFKALFEELESFGNPVTNK